MVYLAFIAYRTSLGLSGGCEQVDLHSHVLNIQTSKQSVKNIIQLDLLCVIFFIKSGRFPDMTF